MYVHARCVPVEDLFSWLEEHKLHNLIGGFVVRNSEDFGKCFHILHGIQNACEVYGSC
jgi:hypothetical protein